MNQPQDMKSLFSQACENNKSYILAVLKKYFDKEGTVLEIGTGTGQHALHFATELPHLYWQTSDYGERSTINQYWLSQASEAVKPRLPKAIELDVMGEWPDEIYNYGFTANTFHIISWPGVQALLANMDKHLAVGGRFVVYGPFNYNGEFTSPSNAKFHQYLQERDPESGIRGFEDVIANADKLKWQLLDDVAMPANNRCLVWEKQA